MVVGNQDSGCTMATPPPPPAAAPRHLPPLAMKTFDRIPLWIVYFQDDIRCRFHAPVHHPFPTPNGSFLLFATFQCFLFRLAEEYVALVLQSCLGGRASDFHVKFLSNNHFHFSIFSKEVDFQIYRKRRVITSSFDIYFHLWSNGTPQSNYQEGCNVSFKTNIKSDH
jgi:hypothetical protein